LDAEHICLEFPDHQYLPVDERPSAEEMRRICKRPSRHAARAPSSFRWVSPIRTMW
jgi:hypothetical protein